MWLDLPLLDSTLEPAIKDERLEIDELWSFIRIKSFQCWLWVVLNRRNRQIVSYHCGPRTNESCQILWDNIPIEYKNGISFSDFWKSYEKVIDSPNHECVGKETGETSHVERWNNTFRQHLARFVRKTLSFSKNELMHTINTDLFIHRYNREFALTI